MLKNYFKTAVRNLSKNKFYSSINIIGLAVGLATCLLIFLYVVDELGYDKYNANAGRIYRANNDIKFNGNYLDLSQLPAVMGPTMLREMPQVQQYVRMNWHGSFLVKKGNENIQEQRVAYADSTLFDVFTLPVIAGDAKTALKDYHSLVITETIAKKYFNSTGVVGKTMLMNDTSNYKITAVIKDIPKQSHFHFDFFVPMLESYGINEDNWLSENYTTYILLKKNADVRQFEAQLNPFMDKHVGPQLQSFVNI
ncbi:MAG TPA: ABC transporter permease, partial [Ginsengibacter sp.]|nr:ABC transporter permease [Ginsengibacter sp.]